MVIQRTSKNQEAYGNQPSSAAWFDRRARRLVRIAAAAVLAGPLYTTTSTGAASFRGLGDLPGGEFYSLPLGVSADGSEVVGVSDGAPGREAFRWTAEGDMIGLGFLPGRSSSEAWGVSADGAVVVGSSGQGAFRWTAEGGMVGLGGLPGGMGTSTALGVSADGTVIVGWAGNYTEWGGESFRWTAEGGMVPLEDPADEFEGTLAIAASADGSAIVGGAYPANGRPSAGPPRAGSWAWAISRAGSCSVRPMMSPPMAP